MIVRMAKVRILGPRDAISDVLHEIQDFGELHPTGPGSGTVKRIAIDARTARETHRLSRVLRRIEAALGALPAGDTRDVAIAETPDLVSTLRTARTVLRQAQRLRQRMAALEEERALLLKYQHFFAGFEKLMQAAARWPHATAYHVVLKKTAEDAAGKLRASLTELLGERFELWTQRLPTGEVALLLLIASGDTPQIEGLLAQAGVTEIPLPESLRGGAPSEAVPALRSRLDALPAELQRCTDQLEQLARAHGPTLRAVQVALRDTLAEHEAMQLAGATGHAFVLEGWLPDVTVSRLRERLDARFRGTVVVEPIAREEWASAEAPVVLHNPRIFRPFEAIVSIMPMPKYGTVDPTPFVAVFFPMFFGLILGDLGYGLVIALIAFVLHKRTVPGSMWRTVSEIAGPCAAFAILFGLLFGEFFGTLGHIAFGLEPLLFDRGEALMPFLGLALAIGLVHILLGLVLGVVSGLRVGPRKALGPGTTALMVIVIVVAILAAAGVLPGNFFTPAVIVLLALFPVLVFAEGIVAPIELLSTLGHILSYARVMALGTASVMMAIAANRMVGAIGSVVVGVLFALLFHLVNFAIGLFSPTIHALRLHYVEFFGTFFSPGGTPYRPLRHWKPTPGRARG